MVEFNPDKHYYGSVCKYNHTSGIRYRVSGECVDCVHERNERWQRDHPSYASQQSKTWREANPEAYRERKRRYRAQNPRWTREYARLQMKQWRSRNAEIARTHGLIWKQDNAHRVREYAANRRALKLNATPVWADWDEIKRLYNVATEMGLVVDHIVPLKSEFVCGLHCANNLQCIPDELNARKSNRYWPGMSPKEP